MKAPPPCRFGCLSYQCKYTLVFFDICCVRWAYNNLSVASWLRNTRECISISCTQNLVLNYNDNWQAPKQCLPWKAMKVSLAHVMICYSGFCFVDFFYYRFLFKLLHIFPNIKCDLQPLAPVCEVCGTAKPKIAKAKYTTWSCKFCTLENSTKLDKCSACDQWRYSYGPPVATYGPSYDWYTIEIYYRYYSKYWTLLFEAIQNFRTNSLYIYLLVQVSCIGV